MTGKGRSTVRSEVDECLLQWTSREMQLVRLHEEILSRREALLNCSLAYNQTQNTGTLNGAQTSEQAYIRNHRLLQDIRGAKEEVYDSLNAAPTPRFMTLQKNYWAMVKSQVPMWEQDLGIQRPSSERATPGDAGTRPKTKHSPSTGTKSVGIQPKKKQTRTQHDARQKSTKSK
ncbi:uncharacterized protein C3orf14-like [Mercenaria mercenaria]|uniref:uncharacterized protein C3orf14-like n=1 Tax=Mercenaria mercenaria TaxID=6596 RepID=UPI00234F79B3|nr:uncharacterized protein C3orf14-like [Mercenaria mercenaria]